MRSRLAALGLLLLLVAAVAAAVGLPLWRLQQSQGAAIEDTRHRITQYRRIAASRDELAGRRAAMDQVLAGERLYLSGETAALAAAELQSVAKREIANVRGRLISTQVMPTLQEGAFQRVAIQVRMRAPLEQVVALLQALYQTRPVLFLDRVSLRQLLVRGPTRKGQPLETQLDFSFELRGYLRSIS